MHKKRTEPSHQRNGYASPSKLREHGWIAPAVDEDIPSQGRGKHTLGGIKGQQRVHYNVNLNSLMRPDEADHSPKTLIPNLSSGNDSEK